MKFDSRRLYPAFAVALALALTVPLTALALWCQPNEWSELLESFHEKPILYLLNALPVGLLLSGLAFLFGNVFYGAAAANAVTGLLSIANRIKIEVRDEPVFPRDLGLWKEAGGALDAYHLQFPVAEVLAVVGLTLALLALGFLTRCQPPSVALRRHLPPEGGEFDSPLCRSATSPPVPGGDMDAPRRAKRQEETPRRLRRQEETPRRANRRNAATRRHWLHRLIGAGACFLAFYVLMVTVYASNDLYDSLKTSSPYRLSVVFNENGFPYNFCHQFTKYLVDRPAGYDRAKAQAWDETPVDASADAKTVNVVVVMNEAFSDITDADAFAYPPDNDPLSNLHAVQSDPHALALRLVVPGFAGGTANTEFDVFTGMQTNALSVGTTSAMRTVNRNLDTLFRAFAADGYRTAFYHPGDAWFYNRENVYRWFGADETLFIEEMDAPEYKGRWVTDNYLAGLIENAFAQSVADGVPLFHASTTIQNHMGYPYSKYGDGHEYAPVPLNVDVPGDVREMLEVYAEGARDADRMLGRLRDFFAATPEPVLLVYYGDHLPYLGDAYAALGMDAGKPDDERENVFSAYETPCVLWANDAAASLLDWERVTQAAGLPENRRLSAAYLGALILELTGRGQRDAWTAFLNDLRRQFPVVQNQYYMLPDGAVIEESALRDTPQANAVRKWRQWSYYKLQHKEWRG